MSTRTLLETITSKAEWSFGELVTKSNFNDWCQHWIDTAQAWRDQLNKEGLKETCAKIDELISMEKAMLAKRKQIEFKYFSKWLYNADRVTYSIGHDCDSTWFVPGTWEDR